MLTDGDDEKPEMTCGGIDGSQRPPRAVLARQHWVDVLVNNVAWFVDFSGMSWTRTEPVTPAPRPQC